MVRDLNYQALKLLSQYIVSNPDKIPEGKILQKTSCMNPEDADIIGILEASKVFFDKPEDKEFRSFLDKAIDFFEIRGLARWNKGELTHLGFRAGTRYEESVDVADEQASESVAQEIDEADINADSNKE